MSLAPLHAQAGLGGVRSVREPERPAGASLLDGRLKMPVGGVGASWIEKLEEAILAAREVSRACRRLGDESLAEMPLPALVSQNAWGEPGPQDGAAQIVSLSSLELETSRPAALKQLQAEAARLAAADSQVVSHEVNRLQSSAYGWQEQLKTVKNTALRRQLQMRVANVAVLLDVVREKLPNMPPTSAELSKILSNTDVKLAIHEAFARTLHAGAQHLGALLADLLAECNDAAKEATDAPLPSGRAVDRGASSATSEAPTARGGSTYEASSIRPDAASLRSNRATEKQPSVEEVDEFSSDGDADDEPIAPSGPTGFKLNLGGVAANVVDDKKPEAIPHTPKGDVVERLKAAAAASNAKYEDDDEPLSDSSAGDDDDEPVAPSGPTGFKLNLGGVAANVVDDKKPEAIPHTPKGDVVERLKAAAAASNAKYEDDAQSDSSEGDDDDEPIAPSGPTGFKLNLGGVAANVVDDKKPEAIPHTPKGDVVERLKAAAAASNAKYEDDDELSDSSGGGDDDDEPVIGQSKPMGFKINLGGVAANVVDDQKPEAIPHTPKGDVVGRLKAAAAASNAKYEDDDDEPLTDSSAGDDDEPVAPSAPPMGMGGFKLNMKGVELKDGTTGTAADAEPSVDFGAGEESPVSDSGDEAEEEDDSYKAPALPKGLSGFKLGIARMRSGGSGPEGSHRPRGPSHASAASSFGESSGKSGKGGALTEWREGNSEDHGAAPLRPGLGRPGASLKSLHSELKKFHTAMTKGGGGLRAARGGSGGGEAPKTHSTRDEARKAAAEKRKDKKRGVSKAVKPNQEAVAEEAGRPRWLVDFAEVECGEMLGAGAFGAVFCGTWRRYQVAVKQLHCTFLTPESEAEFRNEMALMSELRHAHIVKFLGAVHEPGKLCLLCELCRVSLFDVIHDDEHHIEIDEALVVMAQVSLGLYYLHHCDPIVLHLDLKSGNVLLDEHGTAKVTDFGLSVLKQETAVVTSSQGSPQWTAPELLRGAPPDERADVYSFGVLLYEIVSGRIPYDNLDSNQVVMGVICQMLPRPALELEEEEPWPQGVMELMRWCWSEAPADRPTFDQVLDALEPLVDNHPEPGEPSGAHGSSAEDSPGRWGPGTLPVLAEEGRQGGRLQVSIDSVSTFRDVSGKPVTLYCIELCLPLPTGGAHWGVQRRYREFMALDRALARDLTLDRKPALPPKRALSWVRPLAKQDSAAISRRTEDLQRYLQTLLDEPWAWANRPVLRHFLQVPLAVWRDQQAAATRSFQDARKRHESMIGAERSDPKSRSARSSARSKAL